MSMSQTPPHPSSLALDRLSLGLASAEVSEHVRRCEVCQQQLRLLAEAPPAPDPAAVWARIAERERRSRVWWTGASLLAAAACLVLVVGRASVTPAGDMPAPYVGAKGFASVWIYVKRGASTELWDGKRPLAAGDRLRIKLDPAAFRRVEVYSVKDPRAPELLYAGPTAPGSSTLPDAWEVDAQPGAERLVVVLANAPTKPVWDRWLAGEVPTGVSVHPFVLPKASP
jgi:hypothetical protein